MNAPGIRTEFFGPPERPLFGCLHEPATPSPADVALVVCNPFGYEEICAYRSLRHFACAAAESGMYALRFDYDGVGNSAGSDLDADRIAAWVDSVHAAVDHVRRESGASRVVLLGLRLGSTFATLAASTREDVAGLVAIAPVVTGRHFLRELTAVQRSHEGDAAKPHDDGVREALGAILTPDTWTSLGAIDLTKVTLARDLPVLVMDRPSLGRAAGWVQALRSHGSRVEELPGTGYDEMMRDSHDAETPATMIASAMQWVAAHVCSGVRPAAARPERLPRADNLPQRVQVELGVLESPTIVDSATGLFGMLDEPDSRQRADIHTAVLLLSSGTTHSVGPNRLYAELAREWASLGVATLRLDMPGMGESPPLAGERENIVYSTRALESVDVAVEWLRRTFPNALCHGMGICSGGYHAFKATVQGARLDGIVPINPLTFVWTENLNLDFAPFQVAKDAARYRRAIFDPASWMKLLRGGVDVPGFFKTAIHAARTWLQAQSKNVARELGATLPDDLGYELNSLTKRSVQMSFVFADTDPGLALLRDQGGLVYKRLHRAGRVRVDVIPNSNHMFTGRLSRALLRDILARDLGLSAEHSPAAIERRA